ncbi:MAG: hypothetical protein JWM95_539 [Gemmatimonadetes bacterium]|nr:hypothetical protein [Gemmatimonadota bacterium]
MHFGDIALGATIDIPFETTYGNVLTTLTGTPAVSAYADNSSTPITAGITLSADLTVAGSHSVRVVATSGNTFAASKNYTLRISAGTVGGVSAIGRVIGAFSIQARSLESRIPAALTTNGNMKASLVEIITTALTETTGQIAAAFKKFFDIASPTSTMNRITLVDTATTASNAPSAAAIRAEIDANSTQLSAILTAASNLNNLSALANLFGPVILEIPDSGSVAIPFRFVTRDSEGHLIDVDSNAVTLSAINGAGVDRSASWSAATRLSVGVYAATYTILSSSTNESLALSATAAVGGSPRRGDLGVSVADYNTATIQGQILTYVQNAATEAAATTNKSAVLAAVAAVPAQITADHGIGTYQRNTEPLTSTQIQNACDTALNDYSVANIFDVGAVPAAVLAAAAAAPIASNVKRVNDGDIAGDGSDGNPWRAAP